MNDNICPTCGVLKVWNEEKQNYEFHTYWSRKNDCVTPMSSSAFYTKVCRFALNRDKPCINNKGSYTESYDFEKNVPTWEQMKNQLDRYYDEK